mgnify:CR=1 FL=1|jgi:small-conductance mechanosensitive channel|tara:strand:+ start:1633 stop:2049 length:417 start_codon:yes stop_codon:yes gene_type:complete
MGLIITCNFSGYAKLLSKKDSIKLENLGIDLKDVSKYKDVNQQKLKLILKLNRNGKIAKVANIFLKSISYPFVALSGLFFISASNAQNWGGLVTGFGVGSLIVGVFHYGISIPVKNVSNKRFFERDLLIKKLKQTQTR